MDKEFYEIIKDLIHNPTVLEMKNYKQHYDTSCYDHCIEVAYWSYRFCKKHNLDYVAAARAGILHDLFLYNWRHSKKMLNGWHAFEHPKIALKNALAISNLTQKEQDIILKHMWPVTPIPPKSIEGFILTFADKYSASIESLDYYRKMLSKNQNYMYAKALLWMFLFKLK